jgi:hypothetical protein
VEGPNRLAAKELLDMIKFILLSQLVLGALYPDELRLLLLVIEENSKS